MADPSPYKVPLSELLAVKVPEEDQVEENDPTPPTPDSVSTDERRRLEVIRTGGGY